MIGYATSMSHTHTHFPCSNSLFILVIQQRVQPTHSHCSACMCIFSCTLDGPSPFRTLRWLFFNNRGNNVQASWQKKKVTQWKHPIQLNKAGPWIWSDHKSPFAFECLYQDHQGSTSLFTTSRYSGLKSCSGTPVSAEAVKISVYISSPLYLKPSSPTNHHQHYQRRPPSSSYSSQHMTLWQHINQTCSLKPNWLND